MKETDTLRCQVQSSLAMPSYVRLDGDMLRWRSDGSPPTLRQCKDCLYDLIALEDAQPEDILAFAQARGVLGMRPLVTAIWPACENSIEDPFAEPIYEYAEPISAYGKLARHFGAVVRVMNALRKGQAARDSDLMLCAHGGLGLTLETKPGAEWTYINSSPPQIKRALLLASVSSCWEFATISMGPTISRDGFPYSPEVSISFGGWDDGKVWDRDAAERNRGDGTISPPAEYIMPIQDESQVARMRAWEMPYREYVEDLPCAPDRHSRPSALYNVLAYQLLREVTLEKDTYFCSQCERTYAYDPEKAGAPVKGKARTDWGNSKPRKGRPTAFCSEACKKQYDVADKRRNRATRAARSLEP